jgi:hypothetical protein
VVAASVRSGDGAHGEGAGAIGFQPLTV